MPCDWPLLPSPSCCSKAETAACADLALASAFHWLRMVVVGFPAKARSTQHAHSQPGQLQAAASVLPVQMMRPPLRLTSVLASLSALMRSMSTERREIAAAVRRSVHL